MGVGLGRIGDGVAFVFEGMVASVIFTMVACSFSPGSQDDDPEPGEVGDASSIPVDVEVDAAPLACERAGFRFEARSAISLRVFEASGDELTWSAAEAACLELDAYLAILDTPDKRDFGARATVALRTWIGMRLVGDAWRWGNGELVRMTMPPWNTGKPDGGTECGAIDSGDTFDDEECERPLPYLCECANPPLD